MIFQNSNDAYIVGKMHAILGASPEVPEENSRDWRFWSNYKEGYRDGSLKRYELLEQGLSDERIVKYAEAYFGGWTDAAVESMGGLPKPGWRESLRRAALKH